MYILVNWIDCGGTNEYEIMDCNKPEFKKKRNYFKTFLKFAPHLFNLIPAFDFFNNYLYK